MATFVWVLQGTTPTTIDTQDIIQFAAAAFNDPIFVTEYNDSTHVKDGDDDTDKSAANGPRNNKFISQAGGAGGKSEVQVDGGATELLDALTNGDAALKITVSDASAIAITDAVFFSYNGVTPATPASGIDVRAAEVTDTNFTQCEGSAAALVLADQATPATSHDYYIIISKSPTAVGVKTDKLRYEAVIA